MTDKKKTEELNEQELDQVAGGGGYAKLDDVQGTADPNTGSLSSGDTTRAARKGGNVEYSWKVEEGGG